MAVTLSPFEHWTPANTSLPWYQGYNAVKNNRNAEFSRAIFGNVRDAICSVFIIMARLGFLDLIGNRMDTTGGAWQGIDPFRDIPFTLHYEATCHQVSATAARCRTLRADRNLDPRIVGAEQK